MNNGSVSFGNHISLDAVMNISKKLKVEIFSTRLMVWDRDLVSQKDFFPVT